MVDDDRDRGVTGGIIASSNKICFRFGEIGTEQVSFFVAGSSMIVRFELPFDTVGNLVRRIVCGDESRDDELVCVSFVGGFVRVLRNNCGDESRDDELVCVSFVGGFVSVRRSICGDESRDVVPVCVSFVDNRVTNGDGVRALAATLPIRSGISFTVAVDIVFGLSAITSRASFVRLLVGSNIFMLCTIVIGSTASVVVGNVSSLCGDVRRLRAGFTFGVDFVVGATITAGGSSVSTTAAVPFLVVCFTPFDDLVLVSLSPLDSVTFFRFVVNVGNESSGFFGIAEIALSAFLATGNDVVTIFLLVIGFGDKTFRANLSQLLFSGFLIDLSLA